MRNGVPSEPWPAAHGPAAELIRKLGPDATPLGPPEHWPRALRRTIDLLLPSLAQMAVFWGPQFIAFYNDAYARTLGSKHPAAMGRPAGEPSPEVWPRLQATFESVRQSGKAMGAHEWPFVINRGGKEETLFFDFSWSPVRGDGGEVDGLLCIVTETTERVRATRALVASERRAREDIEHMQLAQAAGHIGAFALDLLTDRLQVAGEFCKLFGLPAGEAPLPADIQRLRVDDDAQLSIRERLAAGLEPANATWRIRRADDGALRWISRRAEIVRDAAGKAVLVRGVMEDVTELKQAERLVREADARLRALAQAMPGLALAVNAEGRVAPLHRPFDQDTAA